MQILALGNVSPPPADAQLLKHRGTHTQDLGQTHLVAVLIALPAGGQDVQALLRGHLHARLGLGCSNSLKHSLLVWLPEWIHPEQHKASRWGRPQHSPAAGCHSRAFAADRSPAVIGAAAPLRGTAVHAGLAFGAL